MKRLALLIAAVVLAALALPAPAPAVTASGTLAVSATVQSSINLVFNTDGSGVALGGAGTNAATLAFGSVQAFGTAPGANITRNTGASSFSVSTPFDVNVTKANLTSNNYTLTAQLAVLDNTNTWQVGGMMVTSASPATITSTGTYGSNVPFTLQLTIPFSEAAGTISNTLNFTATAN